MAEIVSNIIQNSLSGFVSGAVTTAGGYAGSAVNGVGGLIEGAGHSVGNGSIAKSFQGVGDYINSYGTAARNATAPNAGGYEGTKRIDAKSKPLSKVSEKKALPSTGERKALPSTMSMKALPAPTATKKITSKADSKPQSSYQAPRSSYTSKAGAYQTPATKKAEPIKVRTLQSGKVVASKESIPQNLKAEVTQAPAAVKSHATKGPSLNPTAASSPKPAIPGYGFGDKGAPKAPSKAGSVVGGPQKNFGGHIPNFGAEKPGNTAPGRKPTTAGVGNKTVTKPPPSKAGSVVAGGGPSFF